MKKRHLEMGILRSGGARTLPVNRPCRAHQRPNGTIDFCEYATFFSSNNRIYSLLSFYICYIVFKMPLNLNFEPYIKEILI